MTEYRPRILLAKAWEPDARTGGGQRLHWLEQGLRACGEVTGVRIPPRPAKFGLLGSPTLNPLAASQTAAFRGDPRRSRHRDGRLADFRRFHPEAYDVVLLQEFCGVWWSGWTDPQRTILDIGDVSSHYFQFAAGKGPLWLRPLKQLRYRWVRRRERQVPDAYRFTLVCSDADRAYLNHPRVTTVPNCYWPRPEMDLPPAPAPDGPMLFVGALTHPPNVRGLPWFIRRVLPLIRAQRPQAVLRIVGMTPEKIPSDWTWLRDPGVDFIGTVADVAPHHQGCPFEVCPLLDGAGTRVKILEALAFARPVVSTNIGAYGLGASAETGVLLHDREEDFAAACIDLLDHPEKCLALGLAGRAFVREHYSPQTVARRLAELVAAIVAECGPAAAG